MAKRRGSSVSIGCVVLHKFQCRKFCVTSDLHCTNRRGTLRFYVFDRVDYKEAPPYPSPRAARGAQRAAFNHSGALWAGRLPVDRSNTY